MFYYYFFFANPKLINRFLLLKCLLVSYTLWLGRTYYLMTMPLLFWHAIIEASFSYAVFYMTVSSFK